MGLSLVLVRMDLLNKVIGVFCFLFVYILVIILLIMVLKMFVFILIKNLVISMFVSEVIIL